MQSVQFFRNEVEAWLTRTYQSDHVQMLHEINIDYPSSYSLPVYFFPSLFVLFLVGNFLSIKKASNFISKAWTNFQ